MTAHIPGADHSGFDLGEINRQAAAMAALHSNDRGREVIRRIVTVDFVTSQDYGISTVGMSGNSVTVLVSPTDPRGFRYRTIAVVDGLNHRSVAEQEVIHAIERRAVTFGASAVRILTTTTEEVM